MMSTKNEKYSNKDLSFLILHYDVYYQCRSPWKWVFEEAFAELFPRETIASSNTWDKKTSTTPARNDQRYFQVSYAKGLPSYAANKNTSRINNNDGKRLVGGGCTLRMEWIGRVGYCQDIAELCCSHYYFHGTSSAMDGLADKDEFVRTLKRYHCEYLSPPTILIDWDASETFCRTVRFPTLLPELKSSSSSSTIMPNELIAANHNNDKHIVAVLKTPLGE